MSLFLATFLTALVLLAFGGHFLWRGSASAPAAKAFPRSQSAAVVTLGLAAVWFLYKVLHLGPADFGQYKNLLFLVFLITAVGSFFYVPDFLAVRGLAALILLTAAQLLEAAFLEAPGSRLFLVSFVYFAIVVALYLGASPFRLRDFLEWLYRSELRPRIFGGVFAAYGALLLVVALTY